MSKLFEELTRPEIEAAIENRPVLLLPLGQTEQHGPHLAVGGDPPVLVLPSISYGYVPKVVQEWVGAFRIRSEVMIDYLADVCTSAVEMGFEKLIIVSTHGPHGNIGPLAARKVFDRTGVGIVFSMPHKVGAEAFRKVRKSGIGGASHAGEYETALMMHFGYPVDLDGLDNADIVNICDEWVSGDYVNGAGKISWSTRALQKSASGVYGDPSCATKETGETTFRGIVSEYCRLIRYVHETEFPGRSQIDP